jgi:hypothetical protein
MSSESPKVWNYPIRPSWEHVDTGDLLKGKVTLEELKSKGTRTLEGRSIKVHVWREIFYFGGLVIQKKERGGALTASLLKWGKGWISTVDMEKHVVLDL